MIVPTWRRSRAVLPALAVVLAACPPTMPPMVAIVISATVRAQDGSPAAGATVSVSHAFGGCDRQLYPDGEVETAADGRIEIRHPLAVRRDPTCFVFVAADADAGLRSDTTRVVLPTIGPEDATVSVSADLVLRPAP
jgi:hypothetical protein